MRLSCPHCGERDLREFTCRGAALDRPGGPTWSDAWDGYLHLRENPAGWSAEFWYHGPCGSWFVADRNTVTHEIRATRRPGEAGR